MQKFKSLAQFRAPLNFELAGKHFHLVMDNGSELSLIFSDGENLQWAEKGKTYSGENYECLKADDTTYFVLVAPNAHPDEHYVLILDLRQDLVTEVKIVEQSIEEHPRLMRVYPTFGAIKVPGKSLPEKRHFFNNTMAGRRITWHYNSGFSIQHIYYKPTFYRLPAFDLEGTKKQYEECTDPEKKAELLDKVVRLTRGIKDYPFAEEPCFHITVNDHLNLFCFCEENEYLYDPEHNMGGGGLLLLQDIERLTDVGLCFNRGDYYLLTAFGVEGFEPDPVESREAPYDNTRLQTIPCIYDIRFDE